MQETKVIASLFDLLAELDEQKIHGALRYRSVNAYLGRKAHQRDIPLSGTFELTPLCNLDCKMCYVHLNADQIGKDERLLTVDEWQTIISQAVDAGMIFADLTGGECLTYPGFREVYLYLLDRGIAPGVLTNGRLLTEETVNFLAQYPPSVLQVTLYGSNEDAYERVTGHRAFQQVMDGIQRAKRRGLNLFLTIMPSRYMQEDASALLALAHTMDIPFIVGGVTIPARSETGRDIQDFAVEADALLRIHQEERDRAAASHDLGDVKPLPQYIPPGDSPKRGLPCGGAHSTFHINWKGELSPCIAFSASVHQPILTSGFMHAWNTVRDIMSGYQPPEACVSCEFRQDCATCPGEKSSGALLGPLNTNVCEKVKLYDVDRKIRGDISNP
ncbi:MAG: radical SAM protein [Bacillota bacterium]|nr:radical SAM protein [Bacillota bacterium]